MAISIDFTNPEGDYPTEPMDWNTGNPFDLSQIYPSTAGLLFLGRDHDCAHTRYYIDDGLVLELQTTAVNQAFGLFVAKPAGGVNEIKIVTVFDFLGSLKQEIRTSAGHRTVPFIGSVGVVANNAKLVADENDDGSVPIGLTRADRRIAATCVLNYDPDGAETVPPSAPPSVQRLRLNAPGILYSSTGPKNPFHEFNFLRPRLSPKPPGGASPQFTLEMTATAATNPDFAKAWMRLSVAPPTFGPDGGPEKVAVSKVFQDFSAITYAGVALAITYTSTTWLQPSMGPLRARIKKLEVDFS